MIVKKQTMKKLFTLGSGALFVSCATAGFSADIIGTIVSPAGEPIRGVTVSVEDNAGAAVGASASDVAGKYIIHALAPGTYTLTANGQTAVAYVGDQGLTVDWGIASNSQVIAAARQGMAPSSALISSKSSIMAARHGSTGKSDRGDNGVQRGDCAEEEGDGEQSDDTQMWATDIDPGAQPRGHRHCDQTESD